MRHDGDADANALTGGHATLAGICTDAAWPAVVVACMTGITTVEDGERCSDQLTKAQRDELDQTIEAMM